MPIRSMAQCFARAAAFALVLLAIPALAQPVLLAPGEGQVRALVIGINEYDSASTLNGAVADALDFKQTLTDLAVEDLTMFLDYDATRDAIEGAIEGLLARAQAGDLVIITFAGHGAKTPERVPGSERDGHDEVFLLGGFGDWGPATRERIYDKEINKWLRQFEARQVDVLFVADVCYGGGLIRSVDPRAGERAYRSAGIALPTEDELEPTFDEEDVWHREADFERVTFLSGVNESTLVPEVQIPGIPGWRGALSYAVARAIEGGLQPDHDGNVTRRQLFEYARQLTYQYSDTRQSIWTEPTRSEELLERVVFRSQGPSEASVPAEAVPIRVRVLGGQDDPLAEMLPLQVPFRLVEGNEPADLIWDVGAHEVVSGGGDVIAQNVDVAELPAIIDRTGAIQTVARLAEANPQPIELLPDAGHHHAGDHVAFRADRAARKYLILFNIAYDGTIQFLFPLSGDRPQLGPRAFQLPLRVQEPFGADQVVAIVSDERLVDLERSLRDLDGQRGAGRLIDALPAGLAEHPSSRIGTAGLFTVPWPAGEGG